MMTRGRRTSLAASAVAAEAVATFLVVRAPVVGSATASLALAALLHGLSVAATVPLLNAIAASYGLARATPLATVAALFLPVLGPLGLLSLFQAVGRHARAGAPAPPPTITRLPLLPADAPDPGGEHLGVGALAARLKFARDPGARVKSVLATRRLDGARATPLLRTALRDRQEDVRLLAYALLEDRERQADATIRSLLSALAAAPPARLATLNERLANAYWELCYQGLVAGELESFALGRAIEHLDAAQTSTSTSTAPATATLVNTAAPAASAPPPTIAAGASAAAARPSGTLAAQLLLRGRVLLRQGDARAARAALEESRRCGMPARTIDPYLTETAVAERGRGAHA